MPHSERHMQIGISTTRAIAQEMSAERVIPVPYDKVSEDNNHGSN